MCAPVWLCIVALLIYGNQVFSVYQNERLADFEEQGDFALRKTGFSVWPLSIGGWQLTSVGGHDRASVTYAVRPADEVIE
jgi:hypothetical protein